MKIGLIFLFLIFLGIVGLNYHTNTLYEDSFTSSYEYDITFEADSELRNVTLYLPLPVYEGESAVGNELTGRGLQDSDGWSLSIEETEHGKMLALRTDRFVPELRPPPQAISDLPEAAEGLTEAGDGAEGQIREERMPEEEMPEEKLSEERLQDAENLTAPSETGQLVKPVHISVSIESDSEINTKFPHGNEPVLNPRYNLTLSTYDSPYAEDREPPTVYEYDSRIYADYESSPDVHVSFSVHFSGGNEWWIYGWNGNEYNEYIFADLRGQQQGWVQVEGKITSGEGNYR